MRIIVMSLLFIALSFAEVPFHNPDLDYKCEPGFQWSRDTVACEQAECPAGAGRTYTLECSCWQPEWGGEPKKTCYDPERAGYATACVGPDEPCPGEKPGSIDSGGGRTGGTGSGGTDAGLGSCSSDSDCPFGYECSPAKSCVQKEEKCNDLICFLEGGKCVEDECVGRCQNVTCEDSCSGSTFKYGGSCEDFTGQCEYRSKTCDNGCSTSGKRCRIAVGRVGFRDIDNATKPLRDIRIEAEWRDDSGGLRESLERRYSDGDGYVYFSESELDAYENGTFIVNVFFEDELGRVQVVDASQAGANATGAQRAALTAANDSASIAINDFTTDFGLNLTFTRLSRGARYARVYYHALEAAGFMVDGLGVSQNRPPEKFYVDQPGASGAYHDAGGAPGAADKGIVYSARVSRYSDPESPTNREWHEFGHHIMYETYGYHYCCVNNNHAGYSNPNSIDSYTEGFAEFMSMMMLDYYNYPVKDLYFVGATPYNMEMNYRVKQQVGGVPMEEMALASIYYDLLDGGPGDEDGIQLSREQIWDVLSKKHQLDGQQRYIHSIWDAYRAFNATGLPGIHEDWGGGELQISRWDRIFIAHGVYADPDSSNSWTPGEEVGYTLIGGVGRTEGKGGVQFNRPEVPGSYIRIEASDAQSGAAIDYYPVHVEVHAEGFEEGEPVSYDYEFDTVPDENGEFNINMPPEDYETTMSFSVGGDEFYERRADVFELTSDEYYGRIDPDVRILKTYPVSLQRKPKPVFQPSDEEGRAGGGVCCAPAFVLLAISALALHRRNGDRPFSGR